MTTKLTKEQAIIISGYSGILICRFSDLHEDVEKRVGRPVWTHEMGDAQFMENLQTLYREDFIALAPEEPK